MILLSTYFRRENKPLSSKKEEIGNLNHFMLLLVSPENDSVF